MTLLERVASTLSHGGVPFALIGASAMAAHGVSRSTFDRDLLVTDSRVLSPSFWSGLGSEVRTDIRRGDAEDPLAGVARIRGTLDRDVDVIAGRRGWMDGIIDRAAPVITSEGPIPIAAAADLILLKLYAGGTQDLWDIEQLLAANSGEHLRTEVQSRIANLPPSAAALWERTFDPAG